MKIIYKGVQFLVTLEVFSSFEPTTTNIGTHLQIFFKGFDHKFKILLFMVLLLEKSKNVIMKCTKYYISKNCGWNGATMKCWYWYWISVSKCEMSKRESARESESESESESKRERGRESKREQEREFKNLTQFPIFFSCSSSFFTRFVKNVLKMGQIYFPQIFMKSSTETNFEMENLKIELPNFFI